jgi:hypothetical protein
MAYFDQYIADGERIVYRTKLHAAIFSFSLFLILIGLIGLLSGFENLGEVCLGFAVVSAIYNLFLRVMSDFVVTNRRIMGKSMGRHDLEVPLIELRDIEFKPGISGRLFDCGTVVITDGQGARHKFPGVPAEFYRQIQARDARIRRILR